MVSEAAVEGVAGHCAKAQKFKVFTERLWRSHGLRRGSAGVSDGREVLMPSSSCSVNFQMLSLLSLP